MSTTEERAARKLTDFWRDAARAELRQGTDGKEIIEGIVHADLSHAICLANDVLHWSREEWAEYILAAWDENKEMQRTGRTGWSS